MEIKGIVLKHSAPTAHCNTRRLHIQRPNGLSCFETQSFNVKIMQTQKYSFLQCFTVHFSIQ